MSDTLSGEQMQAKIQAARREAEGLKDRIKRKKDELADTSRMIAPYLFPSFSPAFFPVGWLRLNSLRG